MSRFNTGTVKAPQKSAIKATTTTATNHNGATGYARDAKSELFISAATSFATDRFYESASALRDRQKGLLREVATLDPEWTVNFLRWLRHDANLRTGPLILAAEAVKVRLDNKLSGYNREMIRAVLSRPDEPGEMLAYWVSEYGKNIPKPVKRGVADAASRMYTEKNWLKYDSKKSAFRFADVIELTHPDIGAHAGQGCGALAKYILDERHHDVPAEFSQADLPMIAENRWLRGVDASLVRNWAKNGTLGAYLANAGMTWEDIPALVNGPWTGELWDSIIPSMGVMALMRNLRNFDAAGISQASVDIIKAKLSDPEQVRKSRALPLRMLQAYKNAPNLRWAEPLENALQASLANVPALKGRTLILVDLSGSMFGYDTVSNAEKAAIFGAALKLRAENADLVYYDNRYAKIDIPKGASILNSLKVLDQFRGGTNTVGALKATFRSHDRVVIITDEQYDRYGWGGVPDPGSALPASTPLITFNIGGYAVAQASGKNRVTVSSLSDSGFKLIDTLGNTSDKWPWEV